MNPKIVPVTAVLTLCLLPLLSPAASAQRSFRRSMVDPPSQEVTAEFVIADSGGVEPRKGTAWKVHVARGLHRGLYITGAWFKPDLGGDWVKILNDARMSELFVPYHQHSLTRYFDLTSFSFPLAEVRAEDTGPTGSLMPPFQGDPFPTVVKEIRDRGVAWKDSVHGVRRGKELVIWGGLEAANYMYLMSYSFHDDGTIQFRVGATGQNLPGQRYEAHMHSAYWRVDIDLIDGKNNSAMLMRHLEDPESFPAEDLKEPFNGGLEGGVDWNPREFTMIRVESGKRNARNETIAYDLMPVRQGTPRHNEEFTRHDLWVSRSHPEKPMEYLYVNIPNIVKNEEVIEQTDIVLWCNSAIHHEPRHEDGKPGSARRFWPGDDGWEGSALVMWSGFDLKPRNLFDRTPFYPYTPAPAPRAGNRGQQDPDDPVAPGANPAGGNQSEPNSSTAPSRDDRRK
jgi:primary-amine oxidase